MLAAVLTPPDIISQFALAVPTLLLYEASIISVRMVEKKRLRKPRPRAPQPPSRQARLKPVRECCAPIHPRRSAGDKHVLSSTITGAES